MFRIGVGSGIACVAAESGAGCLAAAVAERRTVAVAPADADARAWLSSRIAGQPAGTPVRLLLPLRHLAIRYVRLPFTEEEKLRAVLPHELVLPWDAAEVQAGAAVVEEGRGESLLLAVAAPKAVLDQVAGAAGVAGLPPVDLLPLGTALPLFLASRGVAHGSNTLFFFCCATGGRRMAWLAALCRGRLVLLRCLDPVEGDDQLVRWVGATLQLAAVHLGRRLPVDEIVTAGCDAAPLAAPLVAPLAARWRWRQRSLADCLAGTPLADLAAAGPLQVEAAAGALLGRRHLPLTLSPAGGRAAGVSSLPFALSRRRIGVAAALFLAASLLWLADLGVTHRDLARRLALLDTRIRSEFQAVMPQARRIVDPVAQLQAALQAQRRTGQGPAFAAGPSPLAVLADLSRAVPAAGGRVVVEEVEIAPEGVSLRGRGPSFNTIDRLRDGLAALAWVERVEIVGADLDQQGGVVRFDLEVRRRR